MERLAISVREAMEATTLGKTKIYELIADGSLTSVKIGRRTLITIGSIQRLLGLCPPR